LTPTLPSSRGLAKGFEYVPPELRQLVAERDALVGESASMASPSQSLHTGRELGCAPPNEVDE
jgi:hypothetical protein